MFISGLKKSIGDTLFSSRLEDLPAALALAEELEGNSLRYMFAANFIDKESHTRKPSAALANQQQPLALMSNPPLPSNQNAFHKPQGSQVQRRFFPTEPMDIDPSLRTRRAYTDRRQNVNCLEDEVEDLGYEEAAR